MMFDPKVFGEGFHQFVQIEYQIFGFLSIIFHICSLILLTLVFLYGNKYRKAFTVYFAINWMFLFGYWGIYAIIYWSKIGIAYLGAYIFAPILLLLIVINWFIEIKKPKIDLDFKDVKKSRFIILLILIWGIWYPAYVYSEGFIFTWKDLLFSYYGLMPCPTTMFALSLITLKYPKGNKSLFNLLTTYAIFIGTATVMTGWIPDVPFVILGIYSFILILIYKRKAKSKIENHII